MRKKILFYLFLFILSSFLINSVFAKSVSVEINETSKVTKLLIGGYSLDARGVITIKNPSTVSKIYEFNFPIELDSLIGIQKVDLNGVSLNNVRFKFEKIKGYIIDPGEELKIGYRVFGLLNYNIYNKTDKAILEYYIKDYNFLTNPIINLEKPQREGYIHSDDENLTIKEKPTTNTKRLMTIGIQNPTDFDLYLKKVNLYRTSVDDPFFREADLIKSYSNISINPFEYKEFNYFDKNSSDSSVYWISNDIVVDYYIKNISFKREYIEQKPVTIPPPKEPGIADDNYGYIENKTTSDIDENDINNNLLLNSILVRKSVNKTIVREGDTFEVTIRVVNVNNVSIRNLTLFDFIPENYEIVKISNDVIISDKTLLFRINKIGAYDTKIIKYTLKNNDNIKGITYLYPAKLVFRNTTYFSEGILLINDILPDKKVFVQKDIESYDDRFDRVSIKVKNLGSIPIEDILIVENFDNDTIIKEISQIFYKKGVWKIKKLDAGEEWEVTYLIEKEKTDENLPNIYGVDKANVYGTIIRSDEVVTIFHEKPKTIEKVGMFFAIGLLVFYLLF